MRNVQAGMVMTDPDGESVVDDMGQVVPGTVVALHNNIIKALRDAYPAWADYWLIRIDTRGGIVQVYNQAFTGQMGFVMHITKIDPEMRKVREMAGELLERYGLARTKAIDIKQALADLKRDGWGRPIYEK